MSWPPIPSPGSSALRALVLYQWRSGVRLSWQTSSSTVTLLAIGLLAFGDAMTVLARSLIAGRLPLRVLVIAVLAAGLATAGPRVRRGSLGWIVHLPAAEKDRRRALVLAGALALLPVGLLIGAVLLLAGPALLQLGRLAVGLVVALLGVSLAGLPQTPGRSTALRALGWLAAGFALGPGWQLLTGILLLVVAERWAGPIPVLRSPPLGRSQLPPRAAIAWRACEPVASTVLLSLLPLVAGFAFVTNNELTPAGSRLGITVAVGASLTLLVAGVTETLRLRRPAWAWARSLPTSGRRRAGGDALFLAGLGAPGWLLAGWLEPATLAPGAVLTIALAAFGAMAVRCRPRQVFGSLGEVFLIGGLATAVMALWPAWGIAVGLPAAPAWWLAAGRRDQRLAIGRWDARSHHSLGDPLDGAV